MEGWRERTLHRIGEKMNYEKMKIIELLEDPANARKHNEKNLKAIQNSLKKFGQQKPIVVDGEGIVIAGNGTLAAARSLGWSDIAVVRSELKGRDATAYALADNKTSDLSEFDDDALQKALEQLGGLDPAELGFDEESLKSLVDEIQETEEPDVEFSEYIDEANNYVVLLFDNEIDWLSALTHFDIKTKVSRRQNGKPWSKGIGRVIDGAAYVQKMTQADVDGHNG